MGNLIVQSPFAPLTMGNRNGQNDLERFIPVLSDIDKTYPSGRMEIKPSNSIAQFGSHPIRISKA